MLSQKAKGKLAIFLEKLIFFKTENVTADENNKQQTMVRGKRVVLDKSCGTQDTGSTQDTSSFQR